jgi:23S rRNA (cytidine1920-2'-O)/16S rRNA (cytidine1409-2'-O)-methyltransferase
MASAKLRLDKLLVERGLLSSRERAQALILAGRVLVNQQKVEKPGAAVQPDSDIRLLGEDMPYVSRGGWKLEAALAHWQIDLAGRFCMDVGTSTGGFTDCMLQHGAARVLGVDTGYGQIAEKLRTDARVELMERTNARLLAPDSLPAGISFIAMDVSFISATLVLGPVIAAAFKAQIGEANQRREVVVLVKPQFEAARAELSAIQWLTPQQLTA